jgi:carboxylate-amine ligase
VAIAQRVTPYLPVLLALSASFAVLDGRGHRLRQHPLPALAALADRRALREISTAAEHDALVADLVASGTISDPGMIYFDVRPSAHVPTLELRVSDACPEVDDVVLLAALFRALVCRERDAILAGDPIQRRPAPLLRSALWRAARSGLEGSLLDLPRSPRPVPAASAVTQLLDDLSPQLEEAGDRAIVTALADRALARGSSAAQQRAEYQRRGRLADVVDLLLRRTEPGEAALPGAALPGTGTLPLYARAGDEVLRPGGPEPAYTEILGVVERLGPSALRGRERVRNEEQRSRGVTFGVGGARASGCSRSISSPGSCPPSTGRSCAAASCSGPAHSTRSYTTCTASARPSRTASSRRPSWTPRPGCAASAPSSGGRPCAPTSAAWISSATPTEAGTSSRTTCGSLRLGYAVQNRRLMDAVLRDVPRPDGLLDVEGAPGMLRAALDAAALPSAPDSPSVALLSEGPEGSAWFEHRMLGEEMGVPVAATTEILVEDDSVYLLREGRRRHVDVLYLRIDEDALLHAAGADGRPLGAALRRAVDAGRIALANAPGNGVGDDKAVYAFVPGWSSTTSANARCWTPSRPTSAPTGTSGRTSSSGSTASSSSPWTGTAARAS